MKSKIRLHLFFLLLVIPVLMASLALPVEASYGHGRGGWGESPRHFYGVSRYDSRWSLPETAMAVTVAGATFYFLDGVFYRRNLNRYVVVDPPRGAVIWQLPRNRKKIIIQHRPYYFCHGTYYEARPEGFLVVEDPTLAVRHQAWGSKAKSATRGIYQGVDGNEIIFHIPNANGSTTPVTIRESGDGYEGPQGEYYESFPKVAQLEQMYAK